MATSRSATEPRGIGTAAPSGPRRAGVLLALLWLAGMDLRLTLLAVPPIMPLIHRDLRLDEKGVAALGGLPVLLFGLAAIPGALLIGWLGPRRALLIGLALIGAGSALRALGPSAPMLFAMTAVMGSGIAISQPAFPTRVGHWFPRAVARATGVWSNGLLVGEVFSAALTLPVVLPLVGSWEASLVFWSIPVVVTLGLVALGTPPTGVRVGAGWRAGLPNWRSVRQWQLGLLQAGASLIYFGANTFIPDYLHATDQADLVGPALAALNGGQLPASAVIGFVPMRLLARRTTSLAVAGAIVGALVLVVTRPGWPTVLGAAVFGFCAAYVLVLSFAVPALLAAPGEAARLSAGTFAISYSITFSVTLLAGAVWDATHVAASAFLPVIASAALVAVLGPRLAGAASRPPSTGSDPSTSSG